MARVSFSANFDYRPPGTRVMVAYLAGHSYTVKRDCADEALALGKGVEIGAPTREDKPAPLMRLRKAKVRNARGG